MGIHLSKKHGVNPSIEICAVCGKGIGVALLGRLKNDAEAPGEVCLGNLCDTCQGVVDAGGTLIIETVDGEPCSKNPTRTGRIVGITHEAAERLFHYGTYRLYKYIRRIIQLVGITLISK